MISKTWSLLSLPLHRLLTSSPSGELTEERRRTTLPPLQTYARIRSPEDAPSLGARYTLFLRRVSVKMPVSLEESSSSLEARWHTQVASPEAH